MPKKEPEERFAVLRAHKSEPNRWETLITGTLAACENHIKENSKYWYDGEEVILFKVETKYTAMQRYVATVRFTKEFL